MILDISVAVGARSDVGESDWFWKNGTMINDTGFPTSDPSVCQQMTWPLTYRDGVNLRPKPCNKHSFFLCQVKCKYFMSYSNNVIGYQNKQAEFAE